MSTGNAGFVVELAENLRFAQAEQVNFIQNSAFFGVMLSVFAYGIGMEMKKRWKHAVLNPLLIAICISIFVLGVLLAIAYSVAA